jgi:hypothetical protein
MMLPFPWGSLGKVVVVVWEGKMFVPCQSFHGLALYEGGPMPISLDVFKSRLAKTSASTTLIVTQATPPGLMFKLKTKDTIPPRGARVKFVLLDKVLEALLTHGARPEHVAALGNIHTTMVEGAGVRF